MRISVLALPALLFLLLGCSPDDETISYNRKMVKLQMVWTNNEVLTGFTKIRKLKIMVDGYLDNALQVPLTEEHYEVEDTLYDEYVPAWIVMKNTVASNGGALVWYQVSLIFSTQEGLACVIGYSNVFTLEPIPDDPKVENEYIQQLELPLQKAGSYDAAKCS